MSGAAIAVDATAWPTRNATLARVIAIGGNGGRKARFWMPALLERAGAIAVNFIDIADHLAELKSIGTGVVSGPVAGQGIVITAAASIADLILRARIIFDVGKNPGSISVNIVGAIGTTNGALLSIYWFGHDIKVLFLLLIKGMLRTYCLKSWPATFALRLGQGHSSADKSPRGNPIRRLGSAPLVRE